jgi:hypothetical protein
VEKALARSDFCSKTTVNSSNCNFIMIVVVVFVVRLCRIIIILIIVEANSTVKYGKVR